MPKITHVAGYLKRATSIAMSAISVVRLRVAPQTLVHYRVEFLSLAPDISILNFVGSRLALFFYFVDRIKHFININLTNFDDVKGPLKPYARKIKAHRDVCDSFMEAQEYEHAREFLRQLGDA